MALAMSHSFLPCLLKTLRTSVYFSCSCCVFLGRPKGVSYFLNTRPSPSRKWECGSSPSLPLPRITDAMASAVLWSLLYLLFFEVQNCPQGADGLWCAGEVSSGLCLSGQLQDWISSWEVQDRLREGWPPHCTVCLLVRTNRAPAWKMIQPSFFSQPALSLLPP